MRIENIIKDKFVKNQYIHRILTEQNDSGYLAMGYIEKSTNWGSNFNLITSQYDGVYVISGTAIYKDEVNGEQTISSGDYIQRIPKHPHTTLITSDDWKEIYISVGSSLFNLLKEMNVIDNDSPILRPGLDYELIETLMAFFDDLNNATPLELPLLVPTAIKVIARVQYLHKTKNVTTDNALILNMSKKYIIDHIHERPTVEDIANHVNIGYEKFRKLFASYFGISPGYYIQQHRNHLAQRMLVDSDLTIKEIAADLGYSDAFAFSKQFKKMTGMAPKRFRAIYPHK